VRSILEGTDDVITPDTSKGTWANFIKKLAKNTTVKYITENGKQYAVVGDKKIDLAEYIAAHPEQVTNAPTVTTTNAVAANAVAASASSGSSGSSESTTSSSYYDVDTALKSVYSQAKAAGINISAPTSYGSKITSQSQAQKIIDEYTAKANAALTASNKKAAVAASAKATTTSAKATTTTTYDISANIKNIQATAKQYGVTLAGLSQTSFSSQAAAQKALDNYYSSAQKALSAKLAIPAIAAETPAKPTSYYTRSLTSSEQAEYDSMNNDAVAKYGKHVNPEYYAWLKGASSLTVAPKYYTEDAQRESQAEIDARNTRNAQREAQVAASQAKLQESYNAMLKAKGTTSAKNSTNNASNTKSANYSKGTPSTFSNANNTINKITVVKAADTIKATNSPVKATEVKTLSAPWAGKTISINTPVERAGTGSTLKATSANLNKLASTKVNQISVVPKVAAAAVATKGAIDVSKIDATKMSASEIRAVQDATGKTLLADRKTWVDNVQTVGAKNAAAIVNNKTYASSAEQIKSLNTAWQTKKNESNTNTANKKFGTYKIAETANAEYDAAVAARDAAERRAQALAEAAGKATNYGIIKDKAGYALNRVTDKSGNVKTTDRNALGQDIAVLTPVLTASQKAQRTADYKSLISGGKTSSNTKKGSQQGESIFKSTEPEETQYYSQTAGMSAQKTAEVNAPLLGGESYYNIKDWGVSKATIQAQKAAAAKRNALKAEEEKFAKEHTDSLSQAAIKLYSATTDMEALADTEKAANAKVSVYTKKYMPTTFELNKTVMGTSKQVGLDDEVNAVKNNVLGSAAINAGEDAYNYIREKPVSTVKDVAVTVAEGYVLGAGLGALKIVGRGALIGGSKLLDAGTSKLLATKGESAIVAAAKESKLGELFASNAAKREAQIAALKAARTYQTVAKGASMTANAAKTVTVRSANLGSNALIAGSKVVNPVVDTAMIGSMTNDLSKQATGYSISLSGINYETPDYKGLFTNVARLGIGGIGFIKGAKLTAGSKLAIKQELEYPSYKLSDIALKTPEAKISAMEGNGANIQPVDLPYGRSLVIGNKPLVSIGTVEGARGISLGSRPAPAKLLVGKSTQAFSKLETAFFKSTVKANGGEIESQYLNSALNIAKQVSNTRKPLYKPEQFEITSTAIPENAKAPITEAIKSYKGDLTVTGSVPMKAQANPFVTRATHDLEIYGDNANAIAEHITKNLENSGLQHDIDFKVKGSKIEFNTSKGWDTGVEIFTHNPTAPSTEIGDVGSPEPIAKKGKSEIAFGYNSREPITIGSKKTGFIKTQSLAEQVTRKIAGSTIFADNKLGPAHPGRYKDIADTITTATAFAVNGKLPIAKDIIKFTNTAYDKFYDREVLNGVSKSMAKPFNEKVASDPVVDFIHRNQRLPTVEELQGLSPELSTVGASDQAVLYSSKPAALSKTGNGIVDATINESLGREKPTAGDIFKKNEVSPKSQKLTADDIFKKSNINLTSQKLTASDIFKEGDVAEPKIKLGSVAEPKIKLGNDQKSSPNTLSKSDEGINFTNREKLTASDIFKDGNVAKSSPSPISTSRSGRIGSPVPAAGMQNMLRKSRITSPAPIRSRNGELKKQKMNNYSSAPVVRIRTSTSSPKFKSAESQSPTSYSMTSKSKYPSSARPSSSVLDIRGKISSSRPGPIISSRPGPISSLRPSPITAPQQISPFSRSPISSIKTPPSGISKAEKQTSPSPIDISRGSPSPTPSSKSQTSPSPIGGGSSSNYPGGGTSGGGSGSSSNKRKYLFITRNYQEEKKQKDKKVLRFDIKQAVRARDKQLVSKTAVATFADMYGTKAKRKSSPFKK
jgi:hypothetical protein